MGWVSILVCNGCLERIEPRKGQNKADVEHTAERRKWTEIDTDYPAKWFCPTCQRILAAKIGSTREKA